MSDSNTPNVTPISIETEMRNSFMDYAMSVIVARALPDARDGLKPVHRRILFAQRGLNNTYNRPYLKCARIVGDVIGKYHPHGDSAVYDALVRMAQDFSMRYMLVDGQGNFGSVDGDPPAAMRYTECRMSRLSGELLADIDKETVDWQPNYDDKEFEPTVLPAKVPNLLINGATGIAVGMATNIPPHNLGEIIDGTLALIADPKLADDELFKLIPGPDFPTYGVIQGRNGILSAYKTGRGQIVLRGVAHIEEVRKDRYAIVVTELPFMVNKERWVQQTAALVIDKKLEGISDITRRDRTRGHPRRARAQARRRRQGRPQQPVQVHVAADVVLDEHARDRRRPAGVADAAPRAPGVHRSSSRRRHAPHAVRPARGALAARDRRGPRPRGHERRSRDRDHPRIEGHRHRARSA